MFVDQFERKFSYLRLSVTDICNFSCSYCLPDGYQCHYQHQPLSLAEMTRLVKGFAANGLSKVRLTGGEPAVRKDLVHLIEATANISGIETIAVTTNGYHLPQHIQDWKNAGLNAINISVDSLDAPLFKTITGHDRLHEVLQGLEMALDLNLKVKINAVLLKGQNHTQLPLFLDFVKKRDIAIRFIELMQTGDNKSYFDRHHLSGNIIKQHLDKQGWKQLPRQVTAGPAVEYIHPNYQGKIGLIMPYSKDFCSSCNRLRVSSQGNLHLCLFASKGHSLRFLLQRDEQQAELISHIESLLYQKEKTHYLQDGYSGSTYNLSMLGG
ncbi:MAG: GTP 3',8-cyclase MoaA [Gammaproteobacteria bacterium CG22_combo_CG10-13_8_21_14_all_40_8]|nr:MAG: GTP 3',8-cyclase MoaA [Gammaproteobacteria bacterium CG22_combo_CG10-13_8_21_14_all_40_8]